jgi:hypothetical protein
MTKRWAFLLLMSFVGCGLRDGNDLDTEERDAFDRGGDAQLASQAALQISDEMFNFDPTLDVSKSTMENAMAIRAKAAALGCGTASLDAAVVLVDFGAAPGCTLMNGTRISGIASFGVSGGNGTLTVTVAFYDLLVDGVDLTGSAEFTTTTGNTFTVTFNLMSKGAKVMGTIMVAGAPGSMTLSGTMTQQKGTGAATSITFTSVLWKKGDCYPRSGSVAISRGRVSQTATFSATTPSTGKVEVTVGAKTTTVTLPAYGTCPHA